MAQAVQCPRCGEWSRVADGAVGATVACPHCTRAFTARAAALPVSRPRPAPVAPRDDDDVPTDDDRLFHGGGGSRSVLVGLSLVPFAIPLIWLLLPFVIAPRPIFSFALPTAIALGVSGLCLGMAYAANWTTRTRLRAIVVLLAFGYGSAAFLYFLKKEWVQAVRKPFGPPELQWKDFQPPDGAYKVKLPGKPTASDVSPLPGWPLKTFRLAAGPNNDPVLGVAYEVAHGPAQDAVKPGRTPDDEWFAAARKALVERTGGEVTEEKPAAQQAYPAREYTLTMPDGATTRIARIVRVGRQAHYLAVEGTFIAGDHRFVKTFFDKYFVTDR